jgi:hypothetical protein
MKQPRKILFVAAGALAGWMAQGTAQAQDTSTKGGGDQSQGGAQQAPGAMAAHLITASAKVVSVDRDKRELTLKSDDGKPFTINVPESVTRLDNVKPGDKVQTTFYESVALSLAKPGEAAPGEQKSTFGERKPGALPGGMVGQQVTTTAKITKVTPSKDELTIESPTGKANTIKIDDPDVRAQLGHFKVGDKITTTYTQAMATRVTPPRSSM